MSWLPPLRWWQWWQLLSQYLGAYVFRIRAYHHPIFLHPSAVYHYTSISRGLRMPSEASRWSPLSLAILLSYLCWFPNYDASWTWHLPCESPTFVSEMLLQITQWAQASTAEQATTASFAVSVPAPRWRRCWLRALGGLAKECNVSCWSCWSSVRALVY